MINKVRIQNFQSLKDISLDLGRITVILGKSDVGKSAFVRAMSSFFSNRVNKSYAHFDNYPIKVSLTKDGKEGYVSRTNKGVFYFLDGKSYSKTERQVPEEIFAWLNLHPFKVDSDVSLFFNVHSQFDPPFLLQDSSLLIPKVVGKISNLNIAMMALRSMNADVVSFSQELSVKKKDLEEAEAKVEQFEDLEEEEKILQQVTRLLSDVDVLESRIAFLEDFIKLYNEFSSSVSSYKDEVSTTENAISVLEPFTSLGTEHTLLKNLLSDIHKIEATLSNIDTEISSSSIVISTYSDVIKESEQAISKAMSLKSLIEEAASFNSNILLFREQEKALSQLDTDLFSSELSTLDALLFSTKQLSIIDFSITKVLEEESAVLLKAELEKQNLDNILEKYSVCPLINAPFKQGCKDLLRCQE